MYKGISKLAYTLPFLISLLSIIPLVSCDNNVINPDPPNDNDPEIPKKAINPYPPDGATNLPAGTDIGWEIDGDSSSYTFDIYLGTTSPPPLYTSGIIDCTYDPGPLEFETTYYWRIDSVIGDEVTEGDEWSFTTGAKLIRLTFNEAHDSVPSWSPDGTKIVFASDRLDEYSSDLWIIPTSGGEPELLSDPEYRDFHPDWSPDGKTIVFSSSRDHYPEICKIPAGGGESTRLTYTRRNQCPTWSNDSTKIAYVEIYSDYPYSSGALWVMNADGTDQRRLFYEYGDYYSLGWPDWAPDSSRIVYYSGYDDYTDIYIRDAEDPDYFYRVTDDYYKNWAPCWSPDGNCIAFTSERNGNEDIYIVTKYGGNATRITTDPGNDRLPDWSPDGNKIAFMSSRNENWDIWIIDVSGMF